MRGRPVCGICMCPYGDDGDCACKKEGTTMTPQDTMRLAFEQHWIKVRGPKKARHELARREDQPDCYVQDSANRHWITWQAALAQQDELGNASKAEQLLASHDHSLRAEFGRMKAALAQQGEQPVAWPQTPEQISDFIGSNFVWREGNDVAPKDGDKYCVTAHDLLSAFREWPEFAAIRKFLKKYEPLLAAA